MMSVQGVQKYDFMSIRVDTVSAMCRQNVRRMSVESRSSLSCKQRIRQCNALYKPVQCNALYNALYKPVVVNITLERTLLFSVQTAATSDVTMCSFGL